MPVVVGPDRRVGNRGERAHGILVVMPQEELALLRTDVRDVAGAPVGARFHRGLVHRFLVRDPLHELFVLLGILLVVLADRRRGGRQHRVHVVPRDVTSVHDPDRGVMGTRRCGPPLLRSPGRRFGGRGPPAPGGAGAAHEARDDEERCKPKQERANSNHGTLDLPLIYERPTPSRGLRSPRTDGYPLAARASWISWELTEP